MDHQLGSGASGKFDGFKDKYYYGRRPNGFYIPRFRNIGGKEKGVNFLRGYGYQGGAGRGDWSESIAELGYGSELKKALLKPGNWTIGMGGFSMEPPWFVGFFIFIYLFILALIGTISESDWKSQLFLSKIYKYFKKNH